MGMLLAVFDGLGVELEGRVHEVFDVLADGRGVNLVDADAMEETAGQLGALGRVLGQVAGDLGALVAGLERVDVKGGSLRSPPRRLRALASLASSPAPHGRGAVRCRTHDTGRRR
jgi:hypothetical protein